MVVDVVGEEVAQSLVELFRMFRILAMDDEQPLLPRQRVIAQRRGVGVGCDVRRKISPGTTLGWQVECRSRLSCQLTYHERTSC